MNSGDRVNAGQFGLGTIVRLSRNDALVRLDSSGLQVEVPLVDLSMEDGKQPKTSVDNDGLQTSIGTRIAVAKDAETAFEKRLAIEALRFGVVPESQLEELTIEYRTLRDWITKRLPSSHGGEAQVSQVYGPFGSGKSHAMAAARYVARKAGYVTARVEVDGLKVSLADPESLLDTLWGSLVGDGLQSYNTLLELNMKAIRSGHSAPRIAPRGIDRIRDNYDTARELRHPKSLEECGYQLNSIMSSSDQFNASDVDRLIKQDPFTDSYNVKVRRMIGRSVGDRPYDFLEALLGYAKLAELAGYSGLAITIDEFEVEHNNKKSFNRVRDLLTVLGSYWGADTDHPDVPISLFFATVPTSGSIGDQFVDDLVEHQEDGFYELPIWNQQHRSQFAARVYHLYSETYALDQPYDGSITERVENAISDRGEHGPSVMRSFAKEYLSALDSIYTAS